MNEACIDREESHERSRKLVDYFSGSFANRPRSLNDDFSQRRRYQNWEASIDPQPKNVTFP